MDQGVRSSPGRHPARAGVAPGFFWGGAPMSLIKLAGCEFGVSGTMCPCMLMIRLAPRDAIRAGRRWRKPQLRAMVRPNIDLPIAVRAATTAIRPGRSPPPRTSSRDVRPVRTRGLGTCCFTVRRWLPSPDWVLRRTSALRAWLRTTVSSVQTRQTRGPARVVARRLTMLGRRCIDAQAPGVQRPLRSTGPSRGSHGPTQQRPSHSSVAKQRPLPRSATPRAVYHSSGTAGPMTFFAGAGSVA